VGFYCPSYTALPVGYVGICTLVATACWSNLELAVYIEDRLYRSTITASQLLVYLFDSFFAPGYHNCILRVLSLPSICIHDKEKACYFPIAIVAEEPLGEEVDHVKRMVQKKEL
jgi:hypothetical protein